MEREASIFTSSSFLKEKIAHTVNEDNFKFWKHIEIKF